MLSRMAGITCMGQAIIVCFNYMYMIIHDIHTVKAIKASVYRMIMPTILEDYKHTPDKRNDHIKEKITKYLCCETINNNTLSHSTLLA